jgi:hypothetical protein
MLRVLSNRRVWIPILVLFALIPITISAGTRVAKEMEEHQVSREANKWRSAAELATNQAWTESDAVSWLRQNGFQPILHGEGWVESVGQPTEHHLMVGGYRQIANEGRVTRSCWLQIEFVFDTDHHFKRVESHLQQYDPFR